MHISAVRELIKAEINEAPAVSAAATVGCRANSKKRVDIFFPPQDLILTLTAITHRLNNESEIKPNKKQLINT